MVAPFLCQLEKVIETVAPFLRSERVKFTHLKIVGMPHIKYFNFLYISVLIKQNFKNYSVINLYPMQLSQNRVM